MVFVGAEIETLGLEKTITGKHSGGNIRMWEQCLAAGTERLVRVEVNLNGATYIDILL